MTLSTPLRLGTRGSPLALAQAHMVAAALRDAHDLAADDVMIVTVMTSGDRIQDRALADIGGKALWTKELDRALLSGEIDFAVHSMKDVETIRPPELTIAAMLPRADVRDRLVGSASIATLRQDAVVGTSSPRRAAQVRRLRPDARIVLFRGNVATRLAKLESGEADATLLAAAGLDRLGHSEIGAAVDPGEMLPAPAQGAVGIETLTANTAVRERLAAIRHADTLDCVMAERTLLLGLGGTCHSPIAALATIDGDAIHLRGQILSMDGQEAVVGEIVIPRADPLLADALANDLLERATPALRSLFTR